MDHRLQTALPGIIVVDYRPLTALPGLIAAEIPFWTSSGIIQSLFDLSGFVRFCPFIRN